MRQSDRKRFVACLTAAAELYGKPLSDAVIGLWWQALAVHEIDAIEHGFAVHLADPDRGQFMPRPADIARQIGGTSKDSALVAWAKVDRAVREIGPYASVTFDDPILMRVVHDMGGWTQLCGKDDDAWPFIGNEFVTRYQAFRSRQEIPEHPRKLLGIAEAENARKGFAVPDVVLIGDRAAALRVLENGAESLALTVTRASAALQLAYERK